MAAMRATAIVTAAAFASVLCLLLAAPAGSVTASTSISRPSIVQHLIPFGPKRKREMAAYSERHYGQRTGGACAIPR